MLIGHIEDIKITFLDAPVVLDSGEVVEFVANRGDYTILGLRSGITGPISSSSMLIESEVKQRGPSDVQTSRLDRAVVSTVETDEYNRTTESH
jgi:hypothetical protein